MSKRLKNRITAVLIGCIALVGGTFFLCANTPCNCYDEMQSQCAPGDQWVSTVLIGGGTCASQYDGPSSCRGTVRIYCSGYCEEEKKIVTYSTQMQSVSDYCPDCDTNGGGGSNGSGTGTGGSVGDGCWNYWCMPNAY